MAAKCVAIKADGENCTAKSKINFTFGSFCLRHFNLKFAKDEEFRTKVKQADPEFY